MFQNEKNSKEEEEEDQTKAKLLKIDDQQLLFINDDMENLSQLGVLKYPAYPIYKTFKFIFNLAGCNRRKK